MYHMIHIKDREIAVPGEVLAEGEFPLKIVGDGLTGKQKVKNIAKITLKDLKHTAHWTLVVKGAVTVTYDQDEFDALFNSASNIVYYNYTKDNVDYSYDGLPLWIFAAMVDDDGTGGYTLNQTLVNKGYNITVSASDGFKADFPISQAAGNGSIILAYRENGEVLLGDDGPLLITGPDLSGKQKVKNVVKIELTGI